jgi:hypothetical protein
MNKKLLELVERNRSELKLSMNRMQYYTTDEVKEIYGSKKEYERCLYLEMGRFQAFDDLLTYLKK